MIALSALVLALGGGGVAAWAAWAHSTTSPAAPNPATRPDQPQATTSPPDQNDPPQTSSTLLSNAQASASHTSARGYDAGGKMSTYEPEKAIDGLADTAWRCDGDGKGEWIEISFQNKVTLTSIGIIPGFAKTDPVNHTDRYAQNRRISAVRYTFDDGSHFDKTFDTSISFRSAQTLDLPGVSTSHVRITILDSVPGEATNSQQAFDQIAISEITVSGR
ncbi:MAG: discoidin domain-containing protein [Pseudonocardiaceae bacterium]